MKNIKLCVFDMAGTTVNEENLVYKTLCKSIQNRGVKVDLESCLKFGAGKEKHQAILDILNSAQIKASLSATQITQINKLAEQAFTDFKKLLENAYNSKTLKTFPKMLDFFDFLKKLNIKIVLNTGYDRKTAEKILEVLGWEVGKTIDALVTAEDVSQGRPAADMILLAMQKTSIINSKEVLKAGDSCIDIEEGKNANCGYTVATLSGAQKKEDLLSASPDLIVEFLPDLQKYF